MSGFDDIIRKASRRRPHLAEDLAQEARLAVWRATSRGTTNPHHLRVAAKSGIIDFIRREEKTRTTGRPEVPLGNVEPAAPFEPPVVVERCEHLDHLWRAVIGHNPPSRHYRRLAIERLGDLVP